MDSSDATLENLLTAPGILDRGALASKIKLAQLARADDFQAAFIEVTREHAARGALGSSATLARCWDLAVEAAERARDAIIASSFAAGVIDEDCIAAFVAEDMKLSLSTFMTSRFSQYGATMSAAAHRYASTAGQLASRVPMVVQSHYFDRRQQAPSHERPVARLKDQKFGILDSPNLLQEDMQRSRGILGHVVIYLDLDGFKTMNTRFTERVVDRTLLPAVQHIVQDAAAFNGYAYAEGGDEMVIFLPNSSQQMGIALAAKLRALISVHSFDVDGTEVCMTASFGVASSGTLPNSDLIEAANRAKRHAKEDGKNRVVVETADGSMTVDPLESTGPHSSSLNLTGSLA